MKKTLLLFIIALTPIANANARFIDDKTGPAIMSVAEVSKMGDDKPVVMKGSIEKHLGDDKYQFVDETGKIIIEIDGEEWRGVDVTSRDTILVVGETDTSTFRKTQVDVKSI